jgi:hypothetical protein
MMGNRTYHIFAAAAVFGALVWLSVVLREQYQISVSVPLTVGGIPRGWAIRTPLPRTVELRYRGNGWRLLFLALGPKVQLNLPYAGTPPPVATDTDSIPETRSPSRGTQRTVTLYDLADRAASRPGVQLVGVTPDSLFLELDRYEEKRVPVKLDLGLAFREGYGQVGSPLIVPDSVTIGGAATVLRDIISWPTVSENIDNVRMPIETELALAGSPLYDLTLSLSHVQVSINVQAFAEKTLAGLTVSIMNSPSDREVILIPPKIEIVARAGIKQLSTLTPNEFRVSVDYEQILRDSSGVINPVVSSPSGIQVVSRRPERLQYIVRRRL